MVSCTEMLNNVTIGAKGYIIDTRTPAAITTSKAKGGGIETASYYPRWKKINRSKEVGPARYHYLLESYSKVRFCTHTGRNLIDVNRLLRIFAYCYRI